LKLLKNKISQNHNLNMKDLIKELQVELDSDIQQIERKYSSNNFKSSGSKKNKNSLVIDIETIENDHNLIF